jgi:hypothetical protein
VKADAESKSSSGLQRLLRGTVARFEARERIKFSPRYRFTVSQSGEEQPPSQS